jgi:hypothetical protein
MGEREEMAARDAWQVGVFRSVVENPPRLCDGYSSRRQRETQKPSSSGMN